MKERHPTHWIVIAGGPSSGKTSLVNRFAANGLPVNPEAARGYIAEQLRHGLSKEQIRIPFTTFQTAISHRQRAAECALPRHQQVILDGALPDSIAFCRASGHEPWEELLRGVHLHRYHAVFLMEPLPFFEEDSVRTENLSFALATFRHLQDIYCSLGYGPTVVPAFPGTKEESINRRLAFIVGHLHARGVPLNMPSIPTEFWIRPKASPAEIRTP